MEHNPEELSWHSMVDPSWIPALAPVDSIITKLLAWVQEQLAQGHEILPNYTNILRALTIPVDQVRVLIVGQDPYPTPGHAVGLSFSVAHGVTPLPKSLINIFRELQDDLHVAPPRSGDLTPWTKQGVMLLNRSLTVEAGKADAHANVGWEQVTDQVIRVLNNRTDKHGNFLPLVAILWGRKAQQLAPLLNHAVLIESAHPSPLSASRGFFGSKPFSRTNEALVSMGAQPIDWTL